MGFFSNDRSPSDPQYTDDNPSYSLFSPEMGKTVGVAGLLMSATIVLMLLISQTPLATWGLAIYNIFPLLGLLVFGALISGGRHFGMKGLMSDDMKLALGGIVLSVFTYGWFGGAILSQSSQNIYVAAIVITGGITIGITVVATILVFGTDYNFSWTGKASAISFGFGIVLVLITSFISITPLVLVGFLCFLLGFMFDLVYEIHLTSAGARNPVANGLGVYIAFAGVFVHILQLVRRALARN